MQALIEGDAEEFGVCSLVERQVNSFMTSYAKAINKIHSRKGGLFQSPFRRIRISNEQHLQQSIIYTHANAQKHGLVSDVKNYPFTSYHEIVSGKSQLADVGLVLNFFGGEENFIRTHNSQVDFFYSNNENEEVLENGKQIPFGVGNFEVGHSRSEPLNSFL